MSGALSTAIFVAPIAASIGSGRLMTALMPEPHGAIEMALWWSAVMGVATAVLLGCERLSRRALPLAALLKMTMAFPDRAPTRLAVARRVGTTRSLERRVAEAQARGIHDEPTIAAEKILALAAALNIHDRRTRGHSERVRAYVDLIADQLKLAQDDRDRLRWSALLHDVGKLAVHPEILNKSGVPSDEEWEVLRRHPLDGARLTQALAGWLGPWSQTIAEHHERFDGTGYPHGLAGTQISLGGRIVAVADSYEVMTAVRSYKEAISPQAARRELTACAGSQFDPDVVRAFLEVSLGRVRLVAGPLAWLGQLPVANAFSHVIQLGSTAGRAAMTAVAATGSLVVGGSQLHAAAPPVATATTAASAPVAARYQQRPQRPSVPIHAASAAVRNVSGAPSTPPPGPARPAASAAAATTPTHGAAPGTCTTKQPVAPDRPDGPAATKPAPAPSPPAAERSGAPKGCGPTPAPPPAPPPKAAAAPPPEARPTALHQPPPASTDKPAPTAQPAPGDKPAPGAKPAPTLPGPARVPAPPTVPTTAPTPGVPHSRPTSPGAPKPAPG